MSQMFMWGSEDSDIFAVGGAVVDTTAGRFNPLVDCGLAVNAPPTQEFLCDYWRSIGQFSLGLVMVSIDHWTNALSAPTSAGENSNFLMRLLDIHGIPRWVLTNTGQDDSLGPFIMQKIDAAGNYTTLNSGPFTGILPSTLQRLSVLWTPTAVSFYIGAALVAKYVGDTTTDGVTAIGGFDLGEPARGAVSASGRSVWSSCRVADFDCRSIDLMKLHITGAGASSSWNGASDGSTIDEVTLNDTDGIDSGTANQISLFTAPGTLPSGSWAILGVGVAAYSSAAVYSSQNSVNTSSDTPSGSVLPFTDTSAITVGAKVSGTNIATDSTVLSIVTNTSVTLNNAIIGDVPSGEPILFTVVPPQHMNIVLRIGSTNYFSGTPNIAPGPSLDRNASFFNVSPATAQLFTSAELSSLQVGVESLA